MKWMPRKIIGLDIDVESLVATELSKNVRGLYLAKFRVFANLKEFTTNGLFKKGTAVVISLPTQAVLFRAFHLSPSSLKFKNNPKDIRAIVERQNLPLKLEECFWDTFVWNTTLNLIAAKKEVVEKYIAEVAQDVNLRVVSVSASLAALFNVFIYNYPQELKERFALLNIRSSASDLLIYEAKRLMVYPLSLGKKDLQESPAAREKFSLEVQRTFNAHYLQHPLNIARTTQQIYLSGQDSSPELIAGLKKVLGDFELLVLDPFKKMVLSEGASANREVTALSCGLALGELNAQGCLNLNLIKAKLKQERFSLRLELLKKSASFSLLLTFLLLLWFNLNLLKNLKRYAAIYKDTQFRVSQLLPQAKMLKAEKQRLQKTNAYLEMRLAQQKLYLKAMALISESKPAAVEIRNFAAEMKDNKLKVLLSGNAPDYAGLNDFLAKLKKKEEIREAKVVASTFPTQETQDANRAIDFKIVFQVQ